MTKMQFGDLWEDVTTRQDLPLSVARQRLGDKTLAVIGYGVQGPGQAQNLRDSGFGVIVGQREGSASWSRAVADGWIPGASLFPLAAAVARADVTMMLLSDAGQRACWPTLAPHLRSGSCLYFSHGFSVAYRDRTGVVPPKDVDVVLVAPKGSGTTLRRNFLCGRGLSASWAVHQDATGQAAALTLALGIAIGASYLFPTTFEREVYSDLTGERGVLMGALAGLIEAQYAVLRARGHSPSEAFNETVEELTESLVPLVSEHGMPWMFENTSVTAQRGALDWRHVFREANRPVLERLYDRVKDGTEAAVVLERSGSPDYRERLAGELDELRQSELWRTGQAVRALRTDAERSQGHTPKR